MFKEAGLTEELKNEIWSKGASTATLLENIICTPLKKVPAYEKFYEREQKNVRILKPLGEMAIVSRRAKIQSKLSDRGKLCMMLGYAASSLPNVFRLLDVKTKKIVHSRDVMWLGHKFHESSKNPTPMTSAPEDNHEDNEKPSFLPSLRADATIAENTDIRAPNAAKR